MRPWTTGHTAKRWARPFGNRVFNTQRDYAQVSILAVESDGRFVIRFETGELAGKIGGKRNRADIAVMDGCAEDLCVGARVIHVKRDYVDVTVVGIEYSGAYVLRFDSGGLSGRTGGKWGRADLAMPYGCGSEFCVGDRALNIKRESVNVRVVGIERDGAYVVHFENGELAGRRGGKWGREDLARTFGCSQDLCVGQTVLNRQRQYVRTEIVGLQFDGRFVLRFLEGELAGRVGSNWSRDELVAQ